MLRGKEDDHSCLVEQCGFDFHDGVPGRQDGPRGRIKTERAGLTAFRISVYYPSELSLPMRCMTFPYRLAIVAWLWFFSLVVYKKKSYDLTLLLRSDTTLFLSYIPHLYDTFPPSPLSNSRGLSLSLSRLHERITARFKATRLSDV